MIKEAILSPCGLYRYMLTRQWSDNPFLEIVMLNPSTADAVEDDRTIGRCISFAQREEFGGVRVSNLFAFRATKPTALRTAIDPISPNNELVLDLLFCRSVDTRRPILAAWGTAAPDRAAVVLSAGLKVGATFCCLGKTVGGMPRHPLYVPGDQPFVRYP